MIDERLERLLAIPYVAEFYSVELADGSWIRRAEYPELGCRTEGYSEVDVMERLEDERVRFIVDLFERGEVPPMTRPPLESGVSGLSSLAPEQLLERALGRRGSEVGRTRR